MDDATYAKISSTFYGIGGNSRLIRLLRAFEETNKESYDKTLNDLFGENDLRLHAAKEPK